MLARSEAVRDAAAEASARWAPITRWVSAAIALSNAPRCSRALIKAGCLGP